MKRIYFFFYSRTLTCVHDAILEDLVFPAEIVGKRIRVRLDGSRLIKVHLDKAQQTNIEHKVSIKLFGDGFPSVVLVPSFAVTGSQ